MLRSTAPERIASSAGQAVNVVSCYPRMQVPAITKFGGGGISGFASVRLLHAFGGMSQTLSRFQEANLRKTPLRDLKLQIQGTPLESVIDEFRRELENAGLLHINPYFYLSTEWGVPFPSTAIGIPFYLAHPELLSVHTEIVGHVEGASPWEILKYLRHEMGHVVNYAYRLYETEEWIRLFGSITQPYVEDYRPAPFDPHFVQHLPGWYAQMHPDEDWAETFAVWMTPDMDWRLDYAHFPAALAKLEYCEKTVQDLRGRPPLIADGVADEEVSQLACSAEQFYASMSPPSEPIPPGLDGSLRVTFEEFDEPRDSSAQRLPASQLIRSLERQLMAVVYRWTGHFPERTRVLLRHLADRADALQQVYAEDQEQEAAIALTAFVTSLASNYVHRGSYS